MLSKKNIKLSPILSLLSLAIALTTLYLTQLRPPNITTEIGPIFWIYHIKGIERGTAIIVPVSFTNQSPTEGSIRRAAITVVREDEPTQRYFIGWHRYMVPIQVEERIVWRSETMAHALPLLGRTSVIKYVLFPWESYSRPRFNLKEGKYELFFHRWEAGESIPKTTRHTFVVSQEVANQLSKYHKEDVVTSLDLTLDNEGNRNRVLTEQEFNVLLR
jgi:hypothetical protein